MSSPPELSIDTLRTNQVMLFENAVVRAWDDPFDMFRYLTVPDFGDIRIHEDFLPEGSDYNSARFHTVTEIRRGRSELSVRRDGDLLEIEGPLEPGELATISHPGYDSPIVSLHLSWLDQEWKPGVDSHEALPDDDLYARVRVEYDHVLSMPNESKRVHSFTDDGFTVDYDGEVSHDAGWSLSLPGPVSTVLPFEDDLMVVLEPEQLDAGNEFGATPTRNLVRVSSAGGIEWVAEETDREHAYRYPVMKEGELFAKARDMVDLDAATGTVDAVY